MQMCFRALHDLPAGEEITQSYFPLPVGYQERQKRLQEDYGFTCTCPRCKVGGKPFHPIACCNVAELCTNKDASSITCYRSAIEI